MEKMKRFRVKRTTAPDDMTCLKTGVTIPKGMGCWQLLSGFNAVYGYNTYICEQAVEKGGYKYERIVG